MIKFFTKGFFIQYAAVFILGLILWLPAILAEPVITAPDSYWGPVSVILNELFTWLGFSGTILAYLIIYAAGILINQMTGYYGITDRTGTLPLFLYVIISSFVQSLTILAPATLFLPFIILMFIIFLKHDEENESIISSFDAGIVAGLLTLFYYPLAILVLLIWFALFTIRGISWRNYMASFIGWTFPSFMAYAWYLFSGQETIFLNQIAQIGGFHINTAFYPFSTETLLIIFVLLIIFISALKVMNQQKNLSIKQRNYYLIFGVYIILILFINLFFSTGFINILLLAPAAAITLDNLLTSTIKSKWVNLALLLFLLIIITNSWLSFYYAVQ
jgi:hypothetical protein